MYRTIAVTLIGGAIVLSGCAENTAINPVSDNYNQALCDKITEETRIGGLTDIDAIYIAYKVRDDLQVEDGDVGEILHYAIKDQCPGLWEPFYEVVEPYIN